MFFFINFYDLMLKCVHKLGEAIDIWGYRELFSNFLFKY